MHTCNICMCICMWILSIHMSVYLIDESTHPQAGREHEQSVREEDEVAFIWLLKNKQSSFLRVLFWWKINPSLQKSLKMWVPPSYKWHEIWERSVSLIQRKRVSGCNLNQLEVVISTWQFCVWTVAWDMWRTGPRVRMSSPSQFLIGSVKICSSRSFFFLTSWHWAWTQRQHRSITVNWYITHKGQETV